MSDQNPNAYQQLVRAPKISWPALALFVLCLCLLGASYGAALDGRISLWLACLLNGIVTYFIFSVVHDASHGAVSSNKRFNDAIGHIGMLFFGPLAPLNFARWIHMQHHRFTNDEARDPDAFGHKMDWLTPLRWMNFDYFYTRFFLRNAGPMRKKYLPRLLLQLLLVSAILALAITFGYGLEALLLWILPTRISSLLFVLCFVYLPHAPFLATAAEDEYQASNIRVGWGWLLTPLLACQNYHLVHHLYPTAPFYRLPALWHSREAYHQSNNPVYVSAFALR